MFKRLIHALSGDFGRAAVAELEREQLQQSGMAELRAWARSAVFRRTPNRTVLRRAPNPTAMPVRVTQSSQQQQPNTSEVLRTGSAQVMALSNSHGDLQVNVGEPWGKVKEEGKNMKTLTYIERLKEHVKKVKIPELRSAPKSSSDIVLERRRTMPMNPAQFVRRLFSVVSRRPIRDRVIHLLALKNYKETEILSQLQREGLVEQDKECIGRILHEVANLDPNDNSFHLKEDFFKDIQEDWPAYSEVDRQALEVILAQKSAPSENATSQTSSPGPSGRDTPLRTAQKRPLASDFLHPGMNKKQRTEQQPREVQMVAGDNSPSSFILPSTSRSTFNLSPSCSSFPSEVQLENEFQMPSGMPVPPRMQGKTPKSNREKTEFGRVNKCHPLDFNEVLPVSEAKEMSRDCTTEGEKESNSQSVNGIKPDGPILGGKAEHRRVQQRTSGPVPEKKRPMCVRLADIDWSGCAAVYGRPYRDRVIHLLALRDYKEPELLARLQRDGVRPKDKDSLGKILQQVADFNPNDNSFCLKEELFKTIQNDWPGYTKIDRQKLKLILSRKSAPTQNVTSTSQVTSPELSARDIPSRPAQKLPLAPKLTSPVTSKKKNIDHHPSHGQAAAGGHSASPLLQPSTSGWTPHQSARVSSVSPCAHEVQQKDTFRTPSGVPVPARVQGMTPKCSWERAEFKTVQLATIEWTPCPAVYRRPYRDRVIHLLALRSYKKPELLARLERDGVRQKDKGCLGQILHKVAKLNPKDNSFSLKEHLYQTVQSDWPGYTERDRQNLKVILSRKSAPSQNVTSTSQVASPELPARDVPSRPAQKRPLASEFSSPVTSKKQRIAHQPRQVEPAAGGNSSASVLPSTSCRTSSLSPSVGSNSSCICEEPQNGNFQSSRTPEPRKRTEKSKKI